MILDNIAEKPNWVAWQDERRHNPNDPQEKPTKVPYAPDGRRARTNDQATWGTRLEAQGLADRLPKPFGRGGVGLVLAPLAPGLHLGGVDLDACMDVAGALYPWAREIVEWFNCYTEVSPSGQGLKIFFTYEPGQLTERDYNGRRAVRRANASGVPGAKDHGIEFYLKDRYFTVTGMTFEQFDTINTVDVSVMRWLRNRMEEFRQRNNSGQHGQQNEQHDLADIADAFEQIPNDDSVAWDDWNTRGMAIYAATSGSTEGYEIFRRWSEKNRRLYNEAACKERWQAWSRSPPDQLTIRSIFFWAWEANPHWRPPSRNAHSRRRNSAGGFGFPTGEPPLPLKRPIPEGAKFPVAALGSALLGGAQAIEAVTQAPMAMCAAAVLGAASLAVQAIVDVIMPGQRPHPAALFVMVLAESGERKSTVDGLATQTIKERDDEAAADYQALRQVYENDLEAWEASRRVSNRKNQSAEERRQAVRQRIEEAGEKPLPPLEPIMLSSDVTIEGLVKKMERSIGAQGLATAEAGVIVGGHAMVEEVRLRSCATLSRLWDEGRAERVRASEETVRLRGRRLTISVATQPGNGLTWVRQPDLVDQGLASRLLMVLPESKIGQRMLSEESERRREETAPALIEFERRMRDHLQAIPRVAELSRDDQRGARCLAASVRRFIISSVIGGSQVAGWSTQPDPNPEIAGDRRKASYTTTWGTTRSCPKSWCSCSSITTKSGLGRIDQAATAGRPTMGSSLTGVILSSVM